MALHQSATPTFQPEQVAVAKETKAAIKELLEAQFAKHPDQHVALCLGAASAVFEEVLSSLAVDRGNIERARGEFTRDYHKVEDDNIRAASMFWKALPEEFLKRYLNWP